MEANLILFAVICFVLAVVLVLVDVFVPSGGLLSLGALACAVAGVVLLWQVNVFAAVIMIIVIAAVWPIGMYMFFQNFHRLPFTKKLMVQHEPTYVEARGVPNFDDLIGHTGKAITGLRPGGTCLINGKRIDCLAETGMIERDTDVEVVSVRGMEVKVRAL